MPAQPTWFQRLPEVLNTLRDIDAPFSSSVFYETFIVQEVMTVIRTTPFHLLSGRVTPRPPVFPGHSAARGGRPE